MEEKKETSFTPLVCTGDGGKSGGEEREQRVKGGRQENREEKNGKLNKRWGKRKGERKKNHSGSRREEDESSK